MRRMWMVAFAVGLVAAGACASSTSTATPQHRAFARFKVDTSSDPALVGVTEGRYQSLAQSFCQALDRGVTFDDIVGGLLTLQSPQGMAIRPESARSLVATSVVGFCPQQLDRLPLDAKKSARP